MEKRQNVLGKLLMYLNTKELPAGEAANYPLGKKVRIGKVIVDFERRLLWKSGKSIVLMSSYWEVLVALLKARPEAVSHQQLAEILGGALASVGKAIQALRKALSDEGEEEKNSNDCQIVSERGLGYRFVGDVEPIEPNVGKNAVMAIVLVSTGLAVLIAVFTFSFWPTRPEVETPIVLASSEFAQIPVVADAKRAYFGEWDNGRFSIVGVPIGGGPSFTVKTALTNPELCGIGPRTGDLLVRSIPPGSTRQFPAKVWSLNPDTGEASPLGTFSAIDATWSPDEQELVITDGAQIYATKAPFDRKTNVLTFPDISAVVWWPRFSPDGKLLRFTVDRPGVLGRGIWEISWPGGPLRQVNVQGIQNVCCGEWSSAGNPFLVSTRAGGRDEVWALVEKNFGSAKSFPILPSNGALGFRGGVSTRDGRSVLVRNSFVNGEVVRWDESSKKFSPIFRSLSSNMASYSKDGAKVAFVSVRDGSLYIAASESPEKAKRITYQGVEAALPRWSPDGKRVCYMVRQPGKQWKVAIASENSTSELLLDIATTAQADPDWSPDGTALVISGAPAGVASTGNALTRYDLQSKTSLVLANSQGLDSPRWSPRGNLIAAVRTESRRIVAYDIGKRAIVDLTEDNPKNTGYPVWSKDQSAIVFYSNKRIGERIEGFVLSVNLDSKRVTTVSNLAAIRQGAFVFGNWIGLDSNGSLLAVRDLTRYEIERRDWR